MKNIESDVLKGYRFLGGAISVYSVSCMSNVIFNPSLLNWSSLILTVAHIYIYIYLYGLKMVLYIFFGGGGIASPAPTPYISFIHCILRSNKNGHKLMFKNQHATFIQITSIFLSIFGIQLIRQRAH